MKDIHNCIVRWNGSTKQGSNAIITSPYQFTFKYITERQVCCCAGKCSHSGCKRNVLSCDINYFPKIAKHLPLFSSLQTISFPYPSSHSPSFSCPQYLLLKADNSELTSQCCCFLWGEATRQGVQPHTVWREQISVTLTEVTALTPAEGLNDNLCLGFSRSLSVSRSLSLSLSLFLCLSLSPWSVTRGDCKPGTQAVTG